MGFFIFFIIVAVLYFMLRPVAVEQKSMTREMEYRSGIYYKYKRLIDDLSAYPEAFIENQTPSTITITAQNPYAKTSFKVLDQIRLVRVEWTHNSVMGGYHRLNWTFPADQPQEHMVLEIFAELKVYEDKLFGRF